MREAFDVRSLARRRGSLLVVLFNGRQSAEVRAAVSSENEGVRTHADCSVIRALNLERRSSGFVPVEEIRGRRSFGGDDCDDSDADVYPSASCRGVAVAVEVGIPSGATIDVSTENEPSSRSSLTLISGARREVDSSPVASIATASQRSQSCQPNPCVLLHF
jgi:hypothetical protein